MFEEYPDVMTVSQVARALSVGRSRINVLIRTKELSSFKVGRTTLVPKMKLIDFVMQSIGEDISTPQRHSIGNIVGKSSPVGKEIT